MALQIGDIVVIEISGVASDTGGVGRVDGQAVFVAGALPSELLEVQITRVKKRFAEAEIVRVLAPSHARIPPQCPVYAECGGCSLLHCAYFMQLAVKRQICKQSLLRISGVDMKVPGIVRTIKPFHYRDRAIFHVHQGDLGLEIGFYNRKTHRVCSFDSCLLLRQPILELLSQLKPLLNRQATALTGLRHVMIRCSSDGQQLLLAFLVEQPLPELRAVASCLCMMEPRLTAVWQCSGPAVYGAYGSNWQLLAGTEAFEDSIGRLRLQISPASFLQVNSHMTPFLYHIVEEFSQLSGRETVIDLYSGVGGIALYLAGRAAQIIGVESYSPAVEAAVRNARLNQVTNCRFISGLSEEVLPRLLADGLRADVIVLDPPRAGCDMRVLQAAAAAAPQRIVYVSCDVGTLTRDIKRLREFGYVVERLEPVDMFSQTAHIECVCLLATVELAGQTEHSI